MVAKLLLDAGVKPRSPVPLDALFSSSENFRPLSSTTSAPSPGVGPSMAATVGAQSGIRVLVQWSWEGDVRGGSVGSGMVTRGGSSAKASQAAAQPRPWVAFDVTSNSALEMAHSAGVPELRIDAERYPSRHHAWICISQCTNMTLDLQNGHHGVGTSIWWRWSSGGMITRAGLGGCDGCSRAR